MESGDNPAVHLIQILESRQPAVLLCVSREPIAALEDWQKAHPGCRLAQCSGPDFLANPGQVAGCDLAIVCEALEDLDREAGLRLIGTLRNLLSPRLYILVNQNVIEQKGWQETDFFSLGLRHAARFLRGDSDYRAWVYDIDDYNPRRTWNSPEHWANPENWGKYWW